MRAAGLRRGERVALVSRNVPAYIETLFACWWAGLVAVPVNAKLHPQELAFVLADSGARWAFVDAAWQATRWRRCRDGAAPLERAVEFGSPDYAAPAGADGDARRRIAARGMPPPIRRGSSTPAARPGGRRAW